MKGRLVSLDPNAPVEREAVADVKVLEGSPLTVTKNQYALGEHTFVGEWSATVGAWRVSYDEWEFCEMLEGECEIAPDEGDAKVFRKGDAFVIEPGFTGVFRVLAPMKKRYVIRLG
jgi:uncharacterized protein